MVLLLVFRFSVVLDCLAWLRGRPPQSQPFQNRRPSEIPIGIARLAQNTLFLYFAQRNLPFRFCISRSAAAKTDVYSIPSPHTSPSSCEERSGPKHAKSMADWEMRTKRPLRGPVR